MFSKFGDVLQRRRGHMITVLNFLRSLHTLFHHGDTSWHFHQQWMRASLLHNLTTFTNTALVIVFFWEPSHELFYSEPVLLSLPYSEYCLWFSLADAIVADSAAVFSFLLSNRTGDPFRCPDIHTAIASREVRPAPVPGNGSYNPI